MPAEPTTERLPPAPSLLRRPVSEIVAEDYRRAGILRRYGINFCCGGGRRLAEACATANVDPAEVEAALQAHDERVASAAEPTPTDPVALVDYVERVHHAWVRENLPPLLYFTGRVAKVHGEGRPELHDIAECTRELAHALETRMAEEEGGLFPRVRAAAGPTRASSFTPDELRSLEEVHAPTHDLLRELRGLTGDFVPPEGACRTWRAAYAKLEEFEVDLHHHAELEGKVLRRLLA
jgi:regulator of cell morphogenesis and NO signaling